MGLNALTKGSWKCFQSLTQCWFALDFLSDGSGHCPLSLAESRVSLNALTKGSWECLPSLT